MPPNQSLKLTEPAVDDLTRAKQTVTVGLDIPRAEWIPSLRHSSPQLSSGPLGGQAKDDCTLKIKRHGQDVSVRCTDHNSSGDSSSIVKTFCTFGKQNCSLRTHIALSINEGVHSLNGHAHATRQFQLAHAARLEVEFQKYLTWVAWTTVLGYHNMLLNDNR